MQDKVRMDDLLGILRREQDLLDQLRFRFIETRLLLAAGEVRYLQWATAEVEQARRRAREADLLRAAQLQRLGMRGRCGLPTLREVASRRSDLQAGILRDHHEGLCAVVAEIEVIGHRNAELARTGIGDLARATAPLRPSLEAMTPYTDVSDGGAGAIVLAPGPIELDDEDVTHLATESAFQDVITTAARLAMPALLAFLR